MHISSISPNGIVTNLNLALLPVWRVEVVGNENGSLGIAVRYLSPPITDYMFVAAIETRATGGEPVSIAVKGLPRGVKSADKDVFIESLGMLNNADGIKTKDVDEIISQAPALVDVYYAVLGALKTGEERGGSFLDWRWQIRPDLDGLNCVKTNEPKPDPPPVEEEEEEKSAVSESEDQKPDGEAG